MKNIVIVAAAFIFIGTQTALADFNVQVNAKGPLAWMCNDGEETHTGTALYVSIRNGGAVAISRGGRGEKIRIQLKSNCSVQPNYILHSLPQR